MFRFELLCLPRVGTASDLALAPRIDPQHMSEPAGRLRALGDRPHAQAHRRDDHGTVGRSAAEATLVLAATRRTCEGPPCWRIRRAALFMARHCPSPDSGAGSSPPGRRPHRHRWACRVPRPAQVRQWRALMHRSPIGTRGPRPRGFVPRPSADEGMASIRGGTPRPVPDLTPAEPARAGPDRRS